MKKHFNEDLYYPIVTLLLGVVRLLPDSGTWWLIVETVVDLIMVLMLAMTLVVLLKHGQALFHLKPASYVLVGAAFVVYGVFAILQLCGVDTGRWNTVAAVLGLVLGGISLVLTIVSLVQRKNQSSK